MRNSPSDFGHSTCGCAWEGSQHRVRDGGFGEASLSRPFSLHKLREDAEAPASEESISGAQTGRTRDARADLGRTVGSVRLP